MRPITVCRVSFLLAAIDLWLAFVCAAFGDMHFVFFMLLCGLMIAHGLYFKSKVEKGE